MSFDTLETRIDHVRFFLIRNVRRGTVYIRFANVKNRKKNRIARRTRYVFMLQYVRNNNNNNNNVCVCRSRARRVLSVRVKILDGAKQLVRQRFCIRTRARRGIYDRFVHFEIKYGSRRSVGERLYFVK